MRDIPEGGSIRAHNAEFQRVYNQVLEKFLPAELKLRKDKIRVLSVACGFALEAQAVRSVLPTSYYEAIDVEPRTIFGAKAFNPDIPSTRFRVADATRIEEFGQNPWDLIILRNPQLGGIEVHLSPWAKIISNAIESTKVDGYLFMSTHTDLEYANLRDFLRLDEARLTILENLSGEIPFTLPPNPLKEYFTIVARKYSII